MTPDEYATAEGWAKLGRQLLTWSLVISALLSTAVAFALAFLAPGGEAKVMSGLLLLFAGAAVAVAIGFRRLSKPNWKHWIAALVLAVPGGLYALGQLASAFTR